MERLGSLVSRLRGCGRVADSVRASVMGPGLVNTLGAACVFHAILTVT